jgi:hypothetical protein
MKTLDSIKSKIKPIAFAALIAGGVGFIVWGFVLCCQHDIRREHEQQVEGQILIEYNGEESIKCVIQKGSTYATNKPIRTFEIADRFDDRYIDEIAKMLKYDQAKQGKCYRIHYNGDQ